MKNLFTLFLLFLSFSSLSQIVKIEPANANIDQEIKLIYDATQGSGDLVGATKVYMHSGVVTSSPNGTEFNNVIGNWGNDDGVGAMTKVEGETDKWEITLGATAREYYGVDKGVTVFRLAMVFRNADGSKKGAGTPGTFTGGAVISNGDIFVDLNVPKFVVLKSPTQTNHFLEPGETISISAEASADVSTMSVLIDEGTGFVEKTNVTSGKTIQYTYAPTQSVEAIIKVEATIEGETVDVSKTVLVSFVSDTEVLALPQNTKRGINYHNDFTKVTLVLEAPDKDFVYLVGDFSNWQVKPEYLMNKTPDGELFWIELTGLTPQQKYVFQYWVEGTIKIGDPYADEVADPWNDQYIETTVHNDLPVYNRQDFGIATTFQTGQTAFQWETSEANWQRPANEDLVVYELLVRDFVETHSYKTLIDTISYLKTLGVNAIELMPIMEFEGNESWGYNPSYFFAPDKYYGTRNDLKNFIQVCHQNGMAVIMDMVLNHAFGQNPMVMMYFDAGKPSADSPWFNRDARHPFNVGYDFNHESTYTQAFVDSVNAYWISEYHVDGYRFDLSKGFTQTNNPGNVNAWSAFDQSRIDILTRMANRIWETDEEAYVILEHFADNQEETALAQAGMIPWRNKAYDYYQALGGHTTTSFSGAEASTHIAYIESHDEQRQLYEVFLDGDAHEAYNTKDTTIALERLKMNAAFFYTLPGPKMMWQFGELGYDIDINFNDRVGNKPFPWGQGEFHLGYYEDPLRRYTYNAFSTIIKLKTEHLNNLEEVTYTYDFSGPERSIVINSNSLDVVIVGNFGLQTGTISPNFTSVGTWYDLFSGDEQEVTTGMSFNLQPGEFHIYTSERLSEGLPNVIEVYQNPVTVSPLSFGPNDEITITFDATKASADGTEGLVGAESVFMNAGVLFSGTTSGELSNQVTGSEGQMTKVQGESDKWQITLTPAGYFNITQGEPLKIGMIFRDEASENFGKGFRGSVIFQDFEVEGQLITISPAEFDQHTEITLTFDARFGNKGLLNADKVYMHSSVALTPTATAFNSAYVVGTWGADNGVGQLTRSANNPNQWTITFTPEDYYGLNGVTAHRLTMVFRNADGSKKGEGTPGEFENGIVLSNGDIIYDIPGLVTSIPSEVSTFSYYPNPSSGVINFKGEISGYVRSVQLFDLNGNEVSNHTLSGNLETIDVGEIPAGLYLMHITTEKHKLVRKVMVKKD